MIGLGHVCVVSFPWSQMALRLSIHLVEDGATALDTSGKYDGFDVVKTGLDPTIWGGAGGEIYTAC